MHKTTRRKRMQASHASKPHHLGAVQHQQLVGFSQVISTGAGAGKQLQHMMTRRGTTSRCDGFRSCAKQQNGVSRVSLSCPHCSLWSKQVRGMVASRQAKHYHYEPVRTTKPACRKVWIWDVE